MIQRLRHLLASVEQAAGPTFSGIGLLICEAPERLPIISLRDRFPPTSTENIVATLAKISSVESDFHDGFHILNMDFSILKVAQYFSPPIQLGLAIDRSKPIGGRYLAAQFGSAHPNVYLSGIASEKLGIAVFKDGIEVLFEAKR